MKKIMLLLMILVVACTAQIEEGSMDNDMSDTIEIPVQEETETTGEAIEIEMTARNWEFEPSTVTVNQGDKITLKITSVDVDHGIAIPAFGVSAHLSPGQETVVEFVPNRKGHFEFFCNVFCGQGHRDMTGTLIVE